MSERIVEPAAAREPVLNPVDRVSELLFGLFMALTFVGAVSVAESGRAEIRAMLAAALGCNLAWGLADAVMYLVRTITDRGRSLTLVRSVRAAADAETGRKLIEGALSSAVAGLVSATEIEAMRGRILALPDVPERPTLAAKDLLAALAVFLLVVAATFPVVLPFVIFGDVGTAKTVSRGIALAMLFGGGLALGRYAGYGSMRAGFTMTGLGAALVGAIMALGG
jgi:VIT1/CCC1 family predicted Fe2+/Mn2+ transporter